MSTVLPGEQGDGKIRGWHRDRLAVIYVRQSSRQQVADHGEVGPAMPKFRPPQRELALTGVAMFCSSSAVADSGPEVLPVAR